MVLTGFVSLSPKDGGVKSAIQQSDFCLIGDNNRRCVFAIPNILKVGSQPLAICKSLVSKRELTMPMLHLRLFLQFQMQ